MWVGETSGSESLMTHRNIMDDIKTGVDVLLWDECGRDLLTDHTVSGVKET